jgi:hypothetical protein
MSRRADGVRKRTARTRTGRSLGLVVALSVATSSCYRPDRALRVATGTAAHDLCSEAFVAGLDPERTFAESVAPRAGMRWIAWAMRRDIDRERREVTASFGGALASRAVFRDGLGCVLVHGEEVLDSPALPARSDAPLDPALVVTTDPRLLAALDRAFEEPESAPHRWTKAVVVAHEGAIIAERYAPGYGPRTPQLGFSMTKSVMNALVGILGREGKLDVHAPAPIAAWSGASDARGAITLEQLMRMTSGLRLDETGSGFDPSNLMFYDEPDMAAYASRAELVAPPGTRFAYSSASTHLVARVVRDAVGGTGEAVQRFAREELFAPLGMRDVTLEMDATGTPVGGHYLFASARDWARFGQLYLDDGVVGGRRILPEGWVRWSTAATLDTDYGAGFWTSHNDGAHAAFAKREGIPNDAYYALGNLGQRVAVLPTHRLVIVRLGRAHTPAFDLDAFAALVAAAVAATR